MTTRFTPRCRSLFVLLGAATALAAGGAFAADTVPMTDPAQMPPNAIKAMAPPTKADAPEAAFRRLDVAGKGFVTRQDAQALPGFNTAFDLADINHDGRLSPQEFEQAWGSYAKAP